MTIRPYNPRTDYNAVAELYTLPDTFGGQFDEARDSEERLRGLVERKPDSILVAEVEGEIVGAVTLFEDGRSAWLYRFAVLPDHEEEATRLLSERGLSLLKEQGHTQVLVYAPVGNTHFEKRYTSLGFTKGDDYTAYWQDI